MAAMTGEAAMNHSHHPEDIRDRLKEGHGSSYLRDFVYGGIDGAVTIFAVVSRVAGAKLAASTVIILGLANLVADGFSMAAGNYLGTRTEQDEWKRLESFERNQIVHNAEGEREEVRQILKLKGFDGKLLDDAVAVMTRDQERWVEIMMHEEYGLPKKVRSAWLAGASTLGAFVLCGAVPLLPFVSGSGDAFLWSSVLTGVTFFGIGSVKSRWSLQAWYRSGAETALIGAAAAVLAYGGGAFLGRMAG